MMINPSANLSELERDRPKCFYEIDKGVDSYKEVYRGLEVGTCICKARKAFRPAGPDKASCWENMHRTWLNYKSSRQATQTSSNNGKTSHHNRNKQNGNTADDHGGI